MVRKTESPVFSASQVDRYASSIPVSFKLKIPIFKSFPLQLHLFLISLNIILLSLMFQIRDQQTTLMKAGAAGFYTTDDPVEIRLQMYLLDFITRLSTSGLWRLQTPHTPPTDCLHLLTPSCLNVELLSSLPLFSSHCFFLQCLMLSFRMTVLVVQCWCLFINGPKITKYVCIAGKKLQIYYMIWKTRKLSGSFVNFIYAVR